MEVREAYNIWASQYDSNNNKTRDLEGVALKNTLSNISFTNCLEIGCGTGKNTTWLHTKGNKIVSVDFSEAMLAKAKSKIHSEKVKFIQADINKSWDFANQEKFDLATFSLVLEHIENLNSIFEKLSNVITPNGFVYLSELHPFKQYDGSKARFETESGVQMVTCFTHHLSDYCNAASINGFKIVLMEEYFDDDNRTNIPRILTMLFQKHHNELTD